MIAPDPLRVLLVEDSPSDAKLVIHELRKLGRPLTFERVQTASAMREALGNGAWQVIISDWSMPEFSARGALDVMHALELDLPFIIVSGTIGEEAAVEAMRAGARDYVLKDRLGRLVPAVERELHEYEERARHTESELRRAAITDTAPDAIVAFDDIGRLTDFNPAAEKMFGCCRSAALRTLIGDLIPTGDLVSNLLAGDSSMLGTCVEASATRQNGATFPVEVALTRVGGNQRAFIGFIRDISERKRAEAVLRDNEALFRRLFDAGIVGILVLDFAGDIQVANDAFLAMIGWSREDLNAARGHLPLSSPREWQAVTEQAHAHLKERGVATVYEKEYFRRDGRRVPVMIGSALISRTTYLSFVVDLTEKKHGEEERSRLTEDALREQVARRRAEEALRQSEQQLRHAQKMDAVGRLAGGVAHDFNNVLSVILSYSELILAYGAPGETVRQDVEEIKKAATRAAGLTRQLLLFSREQTSEALVLNLNDVIRNMEGMLRRVVGEDVELLMTLSARIGRVCIDPTHIEQVIMNLVVNARDALPTGGHICVETDEISIDEHFAQSHTPAAAGEYVMLVVRDNGGGMDLETQGRIFEPFFTTKARGKGTGLGLSTVFGIVRQNGGGVWVESKPGQGASFKVYIPRVEREIDVVRSSLPPNTLAGSETILLVEDDEQVRAVARNALQRQGYKVIAARDAADALSICERHSGSIDLLLTDVIMPQMSGPDLARQATLIRPTMKVMCMSGYTEDRIVSYGVHGGIAFLQKPIAPSMLARRVRETLDSDIRPLPAPGSGKAASN